MDSSYRIRLMVHTWTHGIDMDAWYRHGLVVLANTHGMDNTYGIDLKSWYSIRVFFSLQVLQYFDQICDLGSFVAIKFF